jgi:hypothetical protein
MNSVTKHCDQVVINPVSYLGSAWINYQPQGPGILAKLFRGFSIRQGK